MAAEHSGQNPEGSENTSNPPSLAQEHQDHGRDHTGGDENGEKQSGSPFRSYLRVFSYSDRLGWVFNSVAVFCMIAAGALLPLMDLVFGQFVTAFNDFAVGASSPAHFRSEVNKFTLWFIYLFVAKFVLVYVWTFLISTNAIRTTKNLRVAFVRQTLRQEIGFFDSPASGSVSGNVTTNSNLVSQGVSEKFGLAVQAVSTFFAAFAVAFAVQWKLTLITICIVPTIVIVTGVCAAIDTVQENRIMSIYSGAGQLAEEIFSSVRNAHAFWAYPKLSRKYESILDEAHAVAKKKSPNYSILFSIEFFSIYCGYGLAFWQGIRLYHSGEVTQPGQIVTVIFAVIVAAQALTQIAPQTITISKAAAAAHELFRTIDRQSKIDSLSPDGRKPPGCRGDLEFRGVSFAYPSRPNVNVLQELSLCVPANKTTAIVGPSGSGKSTIVGLIERWFAPLAGDILIDGTRIDEYNIQWLRTTVRLVQQEPVLFNGSIFENVVHGLAGTPMADLPNEEKQKLVREACQAAYAQEFIERLPKVGQRGATLSGGQKQRIAIARSVISNPRILLLDEATSALDPNAERIVQEALNNVAVGRTMMIIAHRLSTIRDADNIVVLSGGQVAEQGTHTHLVSQGGIYSRLVRAQDLGSGNESEGDYTEDGKDSVTPPAETVDLGLVKTSSGPQIPGADVSGQEDSPNLTDYGVLKCISVIMAEQKDLWVVAAVIGLSCVIGGVTYPALAVVFARVMDVFTLPGSAMVDRGDFYSLMFFVIALGNLAAYAVMGWFTNVLSATMIRRYRLEIFNNILRQDMAFFDRPGNTTGALASRLSSEPTSLQELLSFNVGLILIVIVNLLSSCVLAIATGWKLGLVLVFGALPPLAFSGYLRIRLEFKLDDETSSRFAGSAGIASEAVLAVRTVSSLVLERDVLRRYEESLRNITTRSIKSLTFNMFWYALSQSVSFLCMALGFWYGGRLISFAEYTPSQFYVVFIAVVFSGEAVAMFFQFSSSISKARTAANYIFSLRETVPRDIRDDYPPGSDTDEKPARPAPSVECQDLEFRYPQRPHTRVLKGVSTELIKPGRFVAFVGASGCGKTTMVSLLERFYEPTSGAIFLDGVEASTMHLGQYRRGIALVQQEPVLYQGSIRDNIALGVAETASGHFPSDGSPAPGPTDEDIMVACRQANIADFISSLPEGLDTACGSQGLSLSGGQRQRIAIARALVRKPGMLLLDEATSSLDTESERAVQAALDAAAKGNGMEGEGEESGGRTTIAVAHRLSTIKHADVIFVFSYGRIIEVGSHEELWAKKGVYYEMCLGQSLDKAV